MTDEQKERCDQLFNLGLAFNGSEYAKDDFNVHNTEILCDSKEVWDKKIAKIAVEIKRRKES